MARSAQKPKEDTCSDHPFLLELYKKTKLLSFRSENGNQCVCVDTRDSSPAFVRKLEEYILVNSEHLRLVVRGVDYYLEILDRDAFTTVYQKCMQNMLGTGEHRPILK